MKDLADRFWSRVQKTESCWLWTGSITVYGYGQYQPRRGESHRAHRLAYELSVGPIPDGLVLDHLCRKRSCVNPSHLEPVTNKTNVLRGVGASAINAAKEQCKNGHTFDRVGSKGERACGTCNNTRTADWSREQRGAIDCGSTTRDGGQCQRRIARGQICRFHGTANLPATVLYSPVVSGE